MSAFIKPLGGHQSEMIRKLPRVSYGDQDVCKLLLSKPQSLISRKQHLHNVVYVKLLQVLGCTGLAYIVSKSLRFTLELDCVT